jgi:hypothetical protein
MTHFVLPLLPATPNPQRLDYFKVNPGHPVILYENIQNIKELHYCHTYENKNWFLTVLTYPVSAQFVLDPVFISPPPKKSGSK